MRSGQQPRGGQTEETEKVDGEEAGGGGGGGRRVDRREDDVSVGWIPDVLQHPDCFS